MKDTLIGKVKKLFFSFQQEQSLLKSVNEWVGTHCDYDYCVYTNFYGGDKTLSKQTSGNKKEVIFIAILNVSLEQFLLELNKSHKADFSEDQFRSIYSSSDFNFYAKTDPTIEQLLSAERLFSLKENKIAMRIARVAMRTYIEEQRVLTKDEVEMVLPDIFITKRARVDTTVYVDGVLRSSKVSGNSLLVDALIEASVSATHDPRYKPINGEELDSARINLYIFSDFYRPLSPLMTKGGIDYEKGYLAKIGNKTAWYLPSVFNAKRYRDTHDFFTTFLTKKAGLKPAEFSKVRLFNFHTHTIIESHDHSEVLELNGPLLKQNLQGLSKEQLRNKCTSAAEWLLKRQDKEGYTPTIFDPVVGTEFNSWPRLPSTALYLTHYADTTDRDDFRESSKKTLEYLMNQKHILTESNSTHFLTRVYLYKLALCLNDTKAVQKLHESVETDYSRYIETETVDTLGTITQLQTASLFLFAEEHPFDEQCVQHAYGVVENIFTQFNRALLAESPVSLAGYAELIVIYYRLSRVQSELKGHYNLIRSWYLEQQDREGAFPNFSQQPHSLKYTRGTGKIFEAITIDPDNNESALQALRWLLEYQYNKENSFFIPKERQDLVHGGMRHDAMNYQLWTDSVGHTLMGASRLFKQ